MPKLVSINPTNSQKLGEVEISSKKEIKQKIQNAQAAKEAWKELGVSGRIKLLNKVYEELDKHKDEIADLATKEMGMPKSVQDLIDITPGFDYFKWYLESAEEVLSPEKTFEDEKSVHAVFYEPTGVTAVIVPWNFPFCNFIWGVIPNLIAGNTVVFKHSEECPLSSKRIEEIVSSCDLPSGVFSEVYGDGTVGDFLIHQDVDLVCFTGSTRVGRHIYQVASQKLIRVVLELGGSAPGIVFEDANIDETLEVIYFNRFVNSGQVCDGLKRLIVHKSRFNEVIEKLSKFLTGKKVGDPTNPTTDIGPLVNKKQLKFLKEQVEDAVKKGAKVIYGGKEPGNLNGAYYLPTVLTDIKKNMRVWREEVFGPVLPVVGFETEEEAINLANETKYGLGGYVFTQNKEKAIMAAAKIKTGMVAVNSNTYLYPFNPFGGYKESGLGREHGKWGLRDLCQIKVVAREK